MQKCVTSPVCGMMFYASLCGLVHFFFYLHLFFFSRMSAKPTIPGRGEILCLVESMSSSLLYRWSFDHHGVSLRDCVWRKHKQRRPEGHMGFGSEHGLVARISHDRAGTDAPLRSQC